LRLETEKAYIASIEVQGLEGTVLLERDYGGCLVTLRLCREAAQIFNVRSVFGLSIVIYSICSSLCD